MKFIVIIMLLCNLAANAQNPISRMDSARAVIPAIQFTHSDTIRAVHNLFKSRRNTGGWLVGGSAFFTAFTGIGTLADNNGQNCGSYFCPDAVGSALLIGIGTTPAWIPGSISLIRFNKRREKYVIEEYEKARKLPLYVQRRLAERFYNTNYRFKKKN